MATDVDICNLALVRARVGTIDRLEERSAEAAKCRVLYPMARRHLLEKYPWRFASITEALIETGDTPVSWAYEYSVPNNCLRVLRILPKGVGSLAALGYAGRVEYTPVQYELSAKADQQSRTILCNQPEAYINYTRELTDSSLFSEQFIQSLAWYLAADLAMAFGGDSAQSIRQTALQEYKMTLAEATALDANQAQKPTRVLPANLAVRAGEGSFGGQHYYLNGAFYRRY